MTVTEEDARQIGFLQTSIGVAGSGAVRYGAAMYFYDAGEMTVQMLEVYRMCSKYDGDDPIAVARYYRIAVPPICVASV